VAKVAAEAEGPSRITPKLSPVKKQRNFPALLLLLNSQKCVAVFNPGGYHTVLSVWLQQSRQDRALPCRSTFVDRFATMAEKTQNKPGKIAVKQDISDYVKTLSEEFRMLIVLKAQLYGGSWQPMLDDLRNRLAGKPYIFKLANRIQDDIERIEQMQKFEAEHNVDLANYVEMQ
jgi:hypothetical protein